MNKPIFKTFQSLKASGSMSGNRTAKIIGKKNIKTKRAVYPDPETKPQDYERDLMQSARANWHYIMKNPLTFSAWQRWTQIKKLRCTPFNALVQQMRLGDLRSINMLLLSNHSLIGKKWINFQPMFHLYNSTYVRQKVTCYFQLDDSLFNPIEVVLKYDFLNEPFGWRFDYSMLQAPIEKYTFNLVLKKINKKAVDNISVSGLYKIASQ